MVEGRGLPDLRRRGLIVDWTPLPPPDHARRDRPVVRLPERLPRHCRRHSHVDRHGALTPKTAVTLSAVLNLIGAFLSIEVALTVTNAVVEIQDNSGAPRPEFLADHDHGLLLIVMCGLVGGIIWNLLTWLLGLPSSSSHALFGGLTGPTMAGLGVGAVNWAGDGSKLDGVLGKVVLPAFASPVEVRVVATVGTWLIHKITAGGAEQYEETGFRWGQIGTASLVSLAHGTNDAQSTMGVITLGLIADGSWTDVHTIPLWVKVACAATITLGTHLVGWRIIRTLGKGVVEIDTPQGVGAEAISASVILVSSHLGLAVSTTHVATGSILSTGPGRGGPLGRGRRHGRGLADRPPGRRSRQDPGGLRMIALFGNAVLQALLVSLIVGAGVPALFSVGIRTLTWGADGDAEVSHTKPHPVGQILAYVGFALVVAIILLGVGIVVSSGLGMKLGVCHGLPAFVRKHWPALPEHHRRASRPP